MNDIIFALEERFKEDRIRQELLKGLLQACPEGRIDIVPVKKRPRYYWVSGGKRQYIGKSQTELISSLIGKTYYREMLRATERGICPFKKREDPGGHIWVSWDRLRL